MIIIIFHSFSLNENTHLNEIYSQKVTKKFPPITIIHFSYLNHPWKYHFPRKKIQRHHTSTPIRHTDAPRITRAHNLVILKSINNHSIIKIIKAWLPRSSVGHLGVKLYRICGSALGKYHQTDNTMARVRLANPLK